MDRPETSRPVVTKLRALCLAFPETSEVSFWGHPNFRAGRRTFPVVRAHAHHPVAASLKFVIDRLD